MLVFLSKTFFFFFFFFAFLAFFLAAPSSPMDRSRRSSGRRLSDPLSSDPRDMPPFTGLGDDRRLSGSIRDLELERHSRLHGSPGVAQHGRSPLQQQQQQQQHYQMQQQQQQQQHAMAHAQQQQHQHQQQQQQQRMPGQYWPEGNTGSTGSESAFMERAESLSRRIESIRVGGPAVRAQGRIMVVILV
jgi:hypothetical protein